MKKDVKKLLSAIFVFVAISVCFCLSEASAYDNVYTYEATSSGCKITGYNGAGSSEITIPDSIDGSVVTEIGDNAFSGVKTITKITIPETVKAIGNEAFFNCSNLITFTAPESVTIIGAGVFSGCVNLREVTFSKNVTTIPESAFYNCTSLSSVKLSDNVTDISSKAFYSCTSLKNFVLPESATLIAQEAFLNCSSLASVYLPLSVKNIGKDAFKGCDALQNVYYEGTSELVEDFSVASGNELLMKTSWNFSHIHKASDIIVKVDATCISAGYTESDCLCGFTYITDYVPPTGHDVSVVKIIKEPTCKESGITRICCSRCNYYDEIVLSKTAHRAVVDYAVAADCFTGGKTQGSHCYVCGQVIIAQKEIKPLGHDYTRKIVDREHLVTSATYFTPAMYRYSCSRCSAVSLNSVFPGEKLSLGKPEKMDFASNTNAIKLAWSKVADADFYGLYYKNSKGVWKLYKKLYTTTCLITSLPAGTAYTFGVRAYVEEKGKIVASPYYIELKAATQALKPLKVASAQNENAIKLAWTASKGATGYRVYGYNTKTKSWVVVVKNTTTCSGIINNLKSGISFKFAVRPYINTGTKIVWSSDYATIIAATKPLPPVLKATSLKGGVRFDWSKVSGADGYAIYGSTKPNSGYVRLCVTTGQTYTKSGLASGQTYYFKAVSVKVVNGKYLLSSASETKAVKTR